MKENKVKDNKIKTALIISTILVLFIPMLYSTIYLGAFWDPYENLENVPVAFVNLDKSVTKNGKTYDIGNEVESNLRDNNKLAWKFVDKDEAQKGLEETSYYATITIPEDFSKKISQVDEGNIYDTEIIYSANKGKNFIFSQLSQKATENIKSEVSSNIQKEISKSLVDNMYNIKDSIKDAERGVIKLNEGTTKLKDGSIRLSKGTLEAEKGSVKLQEGLKSASDGTKELKNGVELLSDGGVRLSNGIDSAKVGSERLNLGLKDLNKGGEKLSKGTSQLVNGLENLESSLTQQNDGVIVLVKGAERLSEYNSKLSKGTDDLNNYLNLSLNTLADNLKVSSDSISDISISMKSEIQNIENSDMKSEDKERLKKSILSLEKITQSNKNTDIDKSLREASKALDPLSQDMKKLEIESKKISEGVTLLASSIEDTQTKAKVGVDRLLSGAKEIENGSQSLILGLNTASEGTGRLSEGLGDAYIGSSSLSQGLLSAKEGSNSLNEGLNTAYLKIGDLSKGLSALNTGADSVTTGLDSLDSGGLELKKGLSKGYKELDDKLKFNSNDMAEFISNPVEIHEKSINDINHYGEGLAPYFISLSLWLGSMFVSIILSVIKKLKIGESEYFKGFVKKLLLGLALVSIQSVVLSLSLILVLKIELVSVIGFYLSNMFISMVFFSLMYGVSYAIGIIGTPIMFVFFLLQISSSGGTFPIETAPMFYRKISDMIPMTYAVNTLRMVISGINTSVLNHNLKVLLGFMVLSLVGGLLINNIIKKAKGKNMDKQNIVDI